MFKNLLNLKVCTTCSFYQSSFYNIKTVFGQYSKKNCIATLLTSNFKRSLSSSQNPFSNEDIDHETKLKVLRLEMDVMSQEGRKIPDVKMLTSDHWEHLLTLQTQSARRKYYTFLWKTEKKKENKRNKQLKHKEEVAKKYEEKRAIEENQHIIYGLMNTNFLLRVYETTINLWNNNRLIQAMRFGQKLIFDCSYDDNMNKIEMINAAKQLMLSFAGNRNHTDPFDLHFCNVDLNKSTMYYLRKHIPTIMEPSFPLHIHTECFTKIFPKDKLVYLTPHCQNQLKEFNHDDIYIIGCMVDKINNEPLSLAKAKKLGLRMAKLPLDRYLQWTSGSGKSLTLNQMVDILLDAKLTGNWQYAFRHVPKRKITNFNRKDNDKIILNKKVKKLQFNFNKYGLKT